MLTMGVLEYMWSSAEEVQMGDGGAEMSHEMALFVLVVGGIGIFLAVALGVYIGRVILNYIGMAVFVLLLVNINPYILFLVQSSRHMYGWLPLVYNMTTYGKQLFA